MNNLPMYRHTFLLTLIANLLKETNCKSSKLTPTIEGAEMLLEDNLLHHKYKVSFKILDEKEKNLKLTFNDFLEQIS